MAVSLSTNFTTLFDAEVKHAYQAAQDLMGTCRSRYGVVGSTVQFPKMAKGAATLRIPQSDIVPLNIVASNVSASLSDFVAAEYTDVFDQSHVNYNERQELVYTLSTAIGRRADQIKLDALAAASGTGTVANSIGGSNTNLNVAKIREAGLILNTKNVPKENRYLVVHADGIADLLSETQATSVDFTTSKNLMDGGVSSFLGFNIITLGDRDEGGLAKDGSNDRTCFAFHKASLGYGESIAQKTEINYVPEKTSWLVTSMLSAGATAIDVDGIVKITCRES